MATLDSILSDMRDAKSLIDSRRAVDKDGSSVVTLRKQFAASLASKIGKLASLSPGDAKHLLDAARDCGQDETGVQVIVASIDAKLGVALDFDVQKPASTDHQLLTNAQSWVTESLMASLKGKSTINVKLVTLANYLANHLGCTSPHEQTYKVWLTLALLSHFAVWPRYQIVYDLLQEFKGNVRDCKKKSRSLRRLPTRAFRTSCQRRSSTTCSATKPPSLSISLDFTSRPRTTCRCGKTQSSSRTN